MPNKIQVKVVVTGRVQGVFYRARTKEKADLLGIKGYVKNLPDGSVEAVFQGEALSVTKMTNWCRKGPAAAKVEHVSIQKDEMISDVDTFQIRY